ncbi:MAG: LAGLIDADG family homing endonuclease [Thermoplasmata archaeon]
MLSYSTEELALRWEEFLDEGDFAGRITAIADAYPEERSLFVDYKDIERFDADLAIYLIEHPQNAIYAAEQTIKQFIPPTEEAEIRFRVRGIPRDLRVEVRDLRAKHLGKFISVEGLVRKATEVRPRLVEAVFQCLRCGAIIKEVQEGMTFREPLECYQDQGGCSRTPGSTKFKLLDEGSRFVDTQKIEVQEPPEELRGGEQPQRLVAYVEDDLTGEVFPGDRIVLNGILRSVQKGRFSAKSTLFDIFCDIVSVEMEKVEYEEIEITEEDVKRIEEEAASGDVVRKIVGSIAPSIYGLEVEKEALALQLFGGVAKELPDGRRIRGDSHILLVGDPGVAKSELLTYMIKLSPRGIYASGKAATAAGLCVRGNTLIHTVDGLKEIGEIVRKEIPHPVRRDTARSYTEILYTLENGQLVTRESGYAWRMPKKPCCKLVTSYGKEIETSMNTRFLTCGRKGLEWKRISDIQVGDFVAAPDYSVTLRSDPSTLHFLSFENECLKLSPDSIELLRSRLRRKYGTLRNAAKELKFSEGFIYRTILNSFIPYSKLAVLLESTATSLNEMEIGRVMLRYGDTFRLPKAFDAELMYLIGVVFGDGDIYLDREHGFIRVSSSDEHLLQMVSTLFGDKFGKRPGIERRDNRVPCVTVHSKTVARFFYSIGMRTPKYELELHPRLTTSRHADAFLRGLMDTDECVVNCSRTGGSSIEFSTISKKLARQVQLMLETYGVKARLRAGERRKVDRLKSGQTIRSRSTQYRLQITGKHIDVYSDRIGSNSRKKSEALTMAAGGAHADKDVPPLSGLLEESESSSSKHWAYLSGGSSPAEGKTALILAEVSLESEIHQRVDEVYRTQVAWEQVTHVQRTGEREVFDLTVPATHNFVGNGLIVHNTAAAVRDEFGEGRWTLEAGALVLGDKGLVAIDEVEKMSEQDRSSIHTAMEQQAVHIAKAGITATLQTRCAILAAANPTLGRFDDKKFISEQISLPPTLLSRFDIIFPMMDRPQAQYDRAMAEHILKGHLVGEQGRRGAETVTADTPEVDDAFLPYFKPAFLRKYVAYAKRIYPVMTPEAMQIIQDKYLEIRKQGEVEGGAVPITPRQLEAFIRLAEASARARLSAEVTEEDAQRSVRIVEYWLQKVTGIEGGFDIDIVATGVSSSQRAQMVALRDIIAELSARDGVADLKDIVEAAEERGIPPSRVDAWLKRWSQEGEVYSPAANKWKLVGRF